MSGGAAICLLVVSWKKHIVKMVAGGFVIRTLGCQFQVRKFLEFSCWSLGRVWYGDHSKL